MHPHPDPRPQTPTSNPDPGPGPQPSSLSLTQVSHAVIPKGAEAEAAIEAASKSCLLFRG